VPNHLLSLSDLHLSAVQTHPGEAPKIAEGFFYDVEFANFLAKYSGYANKNDIWQLLILGDGFDLLHTRVGDNAKGLSPASSFTDSRKKLELIFDAHPQFFAALGQWISNGHRLEIVPGNHDIELARPDTQACFKELMLRHAPGQAVAERLIFHPWLYHIPGVLYAEHGHQHHDINGFITLLDPLKNPKTGEIAHPIAAFFDLYLFHMLEHVAPLTGNVRAPLPHLFQGIRKHPLAFLAQFPAHLRISWQLMKFIIQRSGLWLEPLRRQYRQKTLSEYAKTVQLAPQILSELDEIAAIPAAHLFRRMWDKLSGRKVTNDTYIKLSTQKIHTTLKKHGKETVFYLFGHIHNPVIVPIDETSFYLNDGAWTSDTFPGGPGEKTKFPFIHITWGGDSPSTAQLCCWNQKLQSPETLESVSRGGYDG
jgi:UDP-2,3-diacylglucosamine pyrophosphatase LpxH